MRIEKIKCFQWLQRVLLIYIICRNEWGYSCKCIELVEHMAKVDGKI